MGSDSGRGHADTCKTRRGGHPKDRITHSNTLAALREKMLHRMREIKVLDPACGSGNFLYVSLQLLMSLEKEVITHELFNGLTMALPEVHPRQMYGIEINPIAHDLASIVVWIGYIQWRQNNGYATLTRREPILEALSGNIRQMDAIMNADGTEPDWPEVDVIVGNPPFLGGNRVRAELGNDYVENMFALFGGRVPAFADLVCYWFEKARAHIESGKSQRAGLLATNSIRGGVNRDVLKRIKGSGDIFLAWGDREWVLDGAAVRVSMVGFDKGETTEKYFNGVPVTSINVDLTASVDIAQAQHLLENQNISLQGASQKGPFDIDASLAKSLLSAANSSGLNNADVVRPVCNADDLVDGSRGKYSIYFPPGYSESKAAQYEAPYQYVALNVKPVRATNNRSSYRDRWWLYGEARPGLMAAINPLIRYIATPAHSKHRVFAWLDKIVVPTQALILFIRQDDYFFGVLHSRLHEVWSLRMGTSLEDRPRYTPTTTFETFPFPWSPGHEDSDSPAHQAISAAAKQFDEERTTWLNPPGATERELKDRTLTNLYNALNVWRGKETIKIKADAGDFAPRLYELHNTLDMAVCDAYGWPYEILSNEEAILGRLLALNLERAST